MAANQINDIAETITESFDENGNKVLTIIRTQYVKRPSYTPYQKAALERYRQTHKAQLSAYSTEFQKKKYNSDPEYRLKIREKQREYGERKRKERYENDPEYRARVDSRAAAAASRKSRAGKAAATA